MSDRVMLTENVRHEGFRGRTGTVVKVNKSRGVITVRCDNGLYYDAFKENVKREGGGEYVNEI